MCMYIYYRIYNIYININIYIYIYIYLCVYKNENAGIWSTNFSQGAVLRRIF